MPIINANSYSGYLVSIAVGLVFGFVMNKARVIEPAVIRDQMVMHRFVMLKLFLTASATSAISFALLYSFKQTRQNVLTSINNMGSLMNRGYLPFIVGGLLLGAGLDLAGTCPGMVFVETGAWVQNCWFTLLGCFVGTFLYTLLQPYIEKLSTSESKSPKTMMELTGWSYRALAVVFALLLYSVVVGVEYFVPWRSDINETEPMTLTSRSWSPVLAGVIIGLLQLPLNGLMGKFIGTSIAYVALLSQVYDKHPELKSNKKNWWQVLLCCGAVLGSYLSSALHFSSFNVYDASVHGASPMIAFLGGVLLLLGAKTMRACTSGHGLSGMALMSVASIVATMCIFIGGIFTGVLVNRFL